MKDPFQAVQRPVWAPRPAWSLEGDGLIEGNIRSGDVDLSTAERMEKKRVAAAGTLAGLLPVEGP
jgi:hypothetical protein